MGLCVPYFSQGFHLTSQPGIPEDAVLCGGKKGFQTNIVSINRNPTVDASNAQPLNGGSGLRIRKDYCANDDIQSVENNGVRTSAEVPLKQAQVGGALAPNDLCARAYSPPA